MRVRRYRIWKIAQGPSAGSWAVAPDHGDGKKRKPFILARSCAAAMDRLRQRHDRFVVNQKKRCKPPMRRPACRSS